MKIGKIQVSYWNTRCGNLQLTPFHIQANQRELGYIRPTPKQKTKGIREVDRRYSN